MNDDPKKEFGSEEENELGEKKGGSVTKDIQDVETTQQDDEYKEKTGERNK